MMTRPFDEGNEGGPSWAAPSAAAAAAAAAPPSSMTFMMMLELSSFMLIAETCGMQTTYCHADLQNKSALLCLFPTRSIDANNCWWKERACCALEFV
jgi:hypothetical protein